ncbi:MAG: hypothetical protein ABJG41_09915 [Cyclobacteriaceae bacterium]
METIGKIATTLASLITAVIVNCFVIMNLWNWLAVPLFSVQELSLNQSFALVVLISPFAPKRRDNDEPSEGNLGLAIFKLIGKALTRAAVLLSAGYVASLLI